MPITTLEIKIAKVISLILAVAFGIIAATSATAIFKNDMPMVIVLGIFAGVVLWLSVGCVKIIANGTDEVEEDR